MHRQTENFLPAVDVVIACGCARSELLSADVTLECCLKTLQQKDNRIVELEQHIQQLVTSLETSNADLRSVSSSVCLLLRVAASMFVTVVVGS